MSDTEDNVVTGILTLLANRAVGFRDDQLPYTETRKYRRVELVERLKKTRLSEADLDKRKWGVEHPCRVNNPYCCKDEALIDTVLRTMVDDGMIVLRPSGMTHRYFLTRKGAENIRDEVALSAFESNLKAGDVKECVIEEGTRAYDISGTHTEGDTRWSKLLPVARKYAESMFPPTPQGSGPGGRSK